MDPIATLIFAHPYPELATFSCTQTGCPIKTPHHPGEYHPGQIGSPFYIQLLEDKLWYYSLSWGEFLLLYKFYAAHAKKIRRDSQEDGKADMERLIDERIETILEAKIKKPSLEEKTQQLLALLKGSRE
ncbi:MAG: hypothetical protein Q9191_001814 [Dirinaria sp. TL-2023a]